MRQLKFKKLTVPEMDFNIELESYLRQGWLVHSWHWDGSNFHVTLRK